MEDLGDLIPVMVSTYDLAITKLNEYLELLFGERYAVQIIGKYYECLIPRDLSESERQTIKRLRIEKSANQYDFLGPSDDESDVTQATSPPGRHRQTGEELLIAALPVPGDDLISFKVPLSGGKLCLGPETILSSGYFSSVHSIVVESTNPEAAQFLVAVKSLKNIHGRRSIYNNESRVFARLARTTRSTRHIVQLLAEPLSHENELLFFLPLAFGNLQQIFEDQVSLPSNGATDLRAGFLQLSEALETLHGELIFHGDLKPENILCYESEWGFELKLSDFSHSILDSIVGDVVKDVALRSPNPIYSAPELWSQTAKDLRPYDVWAMGCIFLEIAVFIFGGSKDLDLFTDERTTRMGRIISATFHDRQNLKITVVSRLGRLASQEDYQLIALAISEMMDCNSLSRATAQSARKTFSIANSRVPSELYAPKSPLFSPFPSIASPVGLEAPGSSNVSPLGSSRRQEISEDTTRGNDTPITDEHRSSHDSDLSKLRNSLDKALGSNDVNHLEKLLEDHLDLIAVGHLMWVQELRALGMPFKDIATMMTEQNNDAPWIFYDPSEAPFADIQYPHHIMVCSHDILSHAAMPSLQPNDKPLQDTNSTSVDNGQMIKDMVHELCGLAGISPHVRDTKAWTGAVAFRDQCTRAIISYGTGTDGAPYRRPLLHRLYHALRAFCIAVGNLQRLNFCCDTFTVLVRTQEPMHPPSSVHLNQVSFLHASQMLASLEAASHESLWGISLQWGSGHIIRAAISAVEILKTIYPKGFDVAADPDANLELCALATQTLCLGFLSYTTAHVGSIQPFFLDTALEAVYLVGTQNLQKLPETIRQGISAELVRLACLEDMIQGQPVVTFGPPSCQPISASRAESLDRYYVTTTVENLLDTWGPGQIVVEVEDTQRRCVSEIRIGGGVLRCTDPVTSTFHWTRDSPEYVGGLSRHSLHMDGQTVLNIGSSVLVNSLCTANEARFIEQNDNVRELLETHSPRWEVTEKSLGAQGGQYVLVTGQFTRTKIPGMTVKEIGLQRQEDYFLRFFDELWGLQVSYCTGVARRVPLRKVVGDLLDSFILDIIEPAEREIWKTLKHRYNVVVEISEGRVMAVLSQLEVDQYRALCRMIYKMMQLLANTGVSKDGESLVVAWPQKSNVYWCLKLPCKRSQQAWAHVMADCDHTATFAYLSTECLETGTVRCSGGLWKREVLLVESSVSLARQSNAASGGAVVSLEHKKCYFFNKFDGPYLVEARKPEGCQWVELVRASQISNPQILQRMRVRFSHRAPLQSQIRETKPSGNLCEFVTIF